MVNFKDPKTFYPTLLTYREYSNLAMMAQSLDIPISDAVKEGRLSFISGVAREIAEAMYDPNLNVALEIRNAANEWIAWRKETNASLGKRVYSK